MNLSQLIEALEKEDPKRVVRHGFGRPESYRGDYSELAFEPAENVTIGSMLLNARSAMGKTFTGYKGGEYTMRGYTDVNIANWGECGEEITSATLEWMLRGDEIADLKADRERLAAELAEVSKSHSSYAELTRQLHEVLGWEDDTDFGDGQVESAKALKAELAAVKRKWAENCAEWQQWAKWRDGDSELFFDALPQDEQEAKIAHWLKAHEEEMKR